MSLRRPPTRIELKPDDIEEYEQVRPVSSVEFVLYTLVWQRRHLLSCVTESWDPLVLYFI